VYTGKHTMLFILQASILHFTEERRGWLKQRTEEKYIRKDSQEVDLGWNDTIPSRATMSTLHGRVFTMSNCPFKRPSVKLQLAHMFPSCTELICQSYQEAPSSNLPTKGFYLSCAVTFYCYIFYIRFPFDW